MKKRTARGCSLRTRSYKNQPQQLEIRHDLVSNSITSVEKDYLVICDSASDDIKDKGNGDIMDKNETIVMDKVRVFSMFSGIGGFEYGIEQAFGDNVEFVGSSEIDKYASSVYKKHFKGVKNYGDATKIRSEELPDFEFLVGGFPCQSFSLAGKRGGLQDTRGTLFYEIARVLADKRPRYFLLENVKGLLGHDLGKTITTILRVFTDLGYVCQLEVCNSCNFGVPQNRERVFIIGHLGGESRPKVFPLAENAGLSAIQDQSGQGWSQADISPTLRCNITADSAYIVHNIYGGFKEDKHREFKDLCPTLRTPAGGGHIPAVVTHNTLTEATGNRAGSSKEFLRSVMNIAKESGEIRRLTPTECCRLQGFPDGWCDTGIDDNGKEVIISDTQKYRCLGNAVTTTVITALVEKLFLGEGYFNKKYGIKIPKPDSIW